MSQINKIAILDGYDSGLTFEIEEMFQAFHLAGIECELFHESDSILAYKPDCVLVTSPQEAKLTPYPTYGFIRKPRDEYLETPRFLRNIMTYDGYLTYSPRLKTMLKDVLFGARKLGYGILEADAFPSIDTSQIEKKENRDYVVIFEPDFANSRFKNAIYAILAKFDNVYVVTFSVDGVDKYPSRFRIAVDLNDLAYFIPKGSVAISLCSGDQQEQTLAASTLKLASLGAITIAHEMPQLKNIFGDNLYYISSLNDISGLIKSLQGYFQEIKGDRDKAKQKAEAAQMIFNQQISFDTFVQKLQLFHSQILIDKGYLPHPDKAVEDALPSVTYIMRTGGKHRPFLERALDCLVNQKYPDLRVIFVTHVHVPFIDEVIAKYPTIKFKLIESIKSQRSQAIRDGMAAVETDLFGLFDDDDELFPNHVRSLVKTMQYQSNRDWRGEIGMVYSGSIHADDTYPVFERIEFHDPKLVNKNEKRAIEHFRFYSSVLMSQHKWFMPNGWLAKTKLIDNELLEDPGIDTCEDLYFELQIAQKAHFAFSVEVTAIHNFHHLGNSTIDDSHKHIPDTQRIALRNFSRTFPTDQLYDTVYNIIGRVSQHDPNQIRYQDHSSNRLSGELPNQFYPFRYQQQYQIPLTLLGNHADVRKIRIFNLPFKMTKYFFKFLSMDKYKRTYYYNKFKVNLRQEGLFAAISKTVSFFGDTNRSFNSVTKRTPSMTNGVLQYRAFRFVYEFIKFKSAISTSMKKLLNKNNLS